MQLLNTCMRLKVNTDSLTGLSIKELEALAECQLAPAGQARLEELLARQKANQLDAEGERQLDLLLEQIDQLTLVKARARYTLYQNRLAATGS